jgi:preprotein translocase subunit SecG
MVEVILIIHVIIAIAMVISVLLQRSEGGALGMGGGGNMGGLMTTRGSANLLTRATAVLAAMFMGTSILLAILSGATQTRTSIMDDAAIEAPAQPVAPPLPSVPLAK